MFGMFSNSFLSALESASTSISFSESYVKKWFRLSYSILKYNTVNFWVLIQLHRWSWKHSKGWSEFCGVDFTPNLELKQLQSKWNLQGGVVFTPFQIHSTTVELILLLYGVETALCLEWNKWSENNSLVVKIQLLYLEWKQLSSLLV